MDQFEIYRGLFDAPCTAVKLWLNAADFRDAMKLGNKQINL
jgi:hypothetical protein